MRRAPKQPSSWVKGLRRGMNSGILYLMLMPFAIVGFISYRWWKTTALHEEMGTNNYTKRSIIGHKAIQVKGSPCLPVFFFSIFYHCPAFFLFDQVSFFPPAGAVFFVLWIFSPVGFQLPVSSSMPCFAKRWF